MELCTTQATSNLPNITHHSHRFLTAKNPTFVLTKTAFSFKQTPVSRSSLGLQSRICYSNILPRATSSEEKPNGAYGDKVDGVVAVEDVPSVEKNVYNESVETEVPKEESPVEEQTYELLENLNLKFDSEDTYSILLYGSGALVALWLASAIVGSIDSIPLFPKLMEVVGLGYTFWFTTRYLLFKKNRDELATKIEEIKKQVLGSNE